MDQFLNRKRELALLDELKVKNGLVVIFGRRRIGKTRLLTEWLDGIRGIYIQAIEGTGPSQLEQFYHDLREHHDFGIEPKSWSELFRILEMYPGKLILAIDEFPYLVESDKSLPSQFQKWLDHRKKKDILLLLSGSSQKMMHDAFLNRSAPLYSRAIRELRVEEMEYPHFCRAMGFKREDIESFSWFSVTGGVPWYWTLMEPAQGFFDNLERLYFGPSAILENEAQRLLSDEKVGGLIPLSVLEMIGRGASRPSEIASRLEVPQTHLSKTFAALIEGGFIRREMPFGDKKTTLYVIQDPVLRFWFSVCLPHRSRWHLYDEERKSQLVRVFASGVFEQKCRELHPGSRRYWEGDIEFDAVVPIDGDRERVLVVEAKFTRLKSKEKETVLRELSAKWQRSKLASRGWKPKFEVMDFPAYLKRSESPNDSSDIQKTDTR